MSLTNDADRAHRVLRDGGLVLLPTDIGYGLAGCSDAAVARIYELKGRPHTKPCVTVANAAVLADVATLRDERLRGWLAEISRRTPIAVVTGTRVGSALLESLTPLVRARATHAGTIATFHNAGELITQLAERARLDGRLLIGSSANVSFTGNNYQLADVPESIRAGVDLVIDRGTARYHNPERAATTILDLTSYEFRRKGIQHALIEASWQAFRRDVLGENGEPAAASRDAAV
jgi:tRNA A37 threonylcarbamoyladenosine synthetase subunit TsaC/SUA5/YrdC